MDRREACRLLGVEDDVDTTALKRRFRELARDHHPDHGGDPVLFGELRRAFALLSEELTAGPSHTRRPLVSRGRPSRVLDAASAAGAPHALALGAHGHALVGRLADARTCRFTSRAPGARSNRFAASLSVASTSSLDIDLGSPPGSDSDAMARIELTARTRAGRRAVTALDIARLSGAAWVRHRGDALTALRTTLQGRDGDDTPLAHRTAVTVLELLDALAWPISEWSVEASDKATGR